MAKTKFTMDPKVLPLAEIGSLTEMPGYTYGVYDQSNTLVKTFSNLPAARVFCRDYAKRTGHRTVVKDVQNQNVYYHAK